jgi:hypothetical protein
MNSTSQEENNPMKPEDLKILVIGSNGNWAKGDTLTEALKLSYKPKAYLAYIVHPSSTVDGLGSVEYPSEYKPKLIHSVGTKKKKT